MRRGIDIDDVITNTSEAMKDYIMKYDKNGDISNHMEDVMRGDMTNPIIKKFFEENSAKIFTDAKMKENANEVIQRWIDNGNEIVIITTRGEIRFKGSTEITQNYFKLNNIPYTEILFNSFDKAEVCKKNNIDLMIDDSEKYCREVEKENIKSILFTSEINRNINTTIERVNNWLQLEQKVKDMK